MRASKRGVVLRIATGGAFDGAKRARSQERFETLLEMTSHTAITGLDTVDFQIFEYLY
jgi:hypothetical protein